MLIISCTLYNSILSTLLYGTVLLHSFTSCGTIYELDDNTGCTWSGTQELAYNTCSMINNNNGVTSGAGSTLFVFCHQDSRHTM